MPNLTAPKSKRPDDPPATRVLVVREDVGRRSVRPGDEPSRFGVRTGFWSSIGVGAVVFLWMTGHLGETLGFARVLGSPELVSSSDHGLAAGVRMTLAAPLRIFEMALADPMRLAAAFVLVSLPASGLAVARPRLPGAPGPSKLAETFAWLGVIGAILVWILLVTWSAWPERLHGLTLLPLDRALFVPWSQTLAATVGFDAFALVASVLWLVLVFRMPLPRIAVAFAAVAGFIATYVCWTGFATSAGIADALKLERPVIVTLSLDGSSSESLLLGTMQGKTAVLGEMQTPALMVIPAPQYLVKRHASMERWLAPLPEEE